MGAWMRWERERVMDDMLLVVHEGGELRKATVLPSLLPSPALPPGQSQLADTPRGRGRAEESQGACVPCKAWSLVMLSVGEGRPVRSRLLQLVASEVDAEAASCCAS